MQVEMMERASKPLVLLAQFPNLYEAPRAIEAILAICHERREHPSRAAFPRQTGSWTLEIPSQNNI
jgi:hypothetical protein